MLLEKTCRTIGAIVALGFGINLISSAPAEAQTVNRKQELAGAAAAYTALIYESRVLDEIASRYPDLADEIGAARSRFQAKFGTAVDAISTELSDHAPEAAVTAANAAQDTLQKHDPVPDRQSAIKELVNFEGFAKGAIDPPELRKTLLYWRYRANPVAEMLDGFTETFDPDESSKDLRLSLIYPMSWKVMEGDPHLLGEIWSHSGVGVASLHIAVHDIGPVVSASEVTDAFKGAKVINKTEADIAGYPGNVYLIDDQDKSQGVNVAERILVSSVHLGSKTVDFIFIVSVPQARAGELNDDWDRYQPLIKAITATIKLAVPQGD